MQRYDHKLNYIGTGEYVSDMEPSDSGEFYLASEVDARIAELEKFAREFLLYFTSSNGIPVERATIKADSDIVRMARALMERG